MSEVDLGGHHTAYSTAAAPPAAAPNRPSMPWQKSAGTPTYPAAAAAAATADPAGIVTREAALAQKEAALKAKEKELQERETELRRNGGLQPRKNWPLCFPILHHDIAKDIPASSQGTVRLAYWCYLGLVLCLLYNFAGACAMVGLGAPDRMSSWFLAAIYLIAGVPLALLLWYMKLYNTVANDGAVGMLGFFIVFFIHVGFCTWAAIAPPLAGERWSFTGFVAALRAFDVSKVGGVLYIIGACLWTMEAFASWWCLKTVYFNFRSSGKQQQAQTQMTNMAFVAAMQNKV
ncbi:scamp family-domain-containing protein [Scenedesmus sp. NREL 46B-D3]|nr:scamp family-domain-containing protein [Scenedesmus sp. NREL 46B-D3]